jgi:hypothetical protein
MLGLLLLLLINEITNQLTARTKDLNKLAVTQPVMVWRPVMEHECSLSGLRSSTTQHDPGPNETNLFKSVHLICLRPF